MSSSKQQWFGVPQTNFNIEQQQKISDPTKNHIMLSVQCFTTSDKQNKILFSKIVPLFLVMLC
jgi:hypothetical protein